MKRSSGIPAMFAGAAVLFLVITALVLVPSPAAADTTAVGGVAGDLYPIANNDIRMESETVQAICYRYLAEFRVDFKFVNSGEPQTVQLGFPYLAPAPYKGVASPIGFRAWQDGSPLEVRLGGSVTASSTTTPTGPPYFPVESYFLMNAAFPPGDTMITVSYIAQPTWLGNSRLPAATPPEVVALGLEGQGAKYDYWLHTGAGWAGTIGKAVVRFRLADSFDGWAVDVKRADPALKSYEFLPATTRPETYTHSDAGTYQWIFEDLEPTEADDIVLAFTGGAFEWLQSQGPDHSGKVPPAYGALPIPITASDNLAYHYDGRASARDGWWAVDGSLPNPWGVPAPGKGAWIKLGIEGNQNLSEIRILPGRFDDFGSFEEYGRPKTVRVTLSDRTSMTITLEDEPSLQRFPLSGKASWVKLDIVDVYPGTKNNDTYISMIDFGTEPAPSFLLFAELIGGTASGQPANASPTTGASTTEGIGTTTGFQTGAASPQAASSPAHVPWRVIWPIAGVVAAVGAVLLLAWGARRRRRMRRARART